MIEVVQHASMERLLEGFRPGTLTLLVARKAGLRPNSNQAGMPELRISEQRCRISWTKMTTLSLVLISVLGLSSTHSAAKPHKLGDEQRWRRLPRPPMVMGAVPALQFSLVLFPLSLSCRRLCPAGSLC